MKILLCCLLLAIVFSQVGQSTNQSSQPFRIVPILKRENGYSTFESIAIRSQSELDSFLKATASQLGWNHQRVFENSLRDANIDFSKEALVLLRHTEGSGSVQVEFKTPVLQGRKLVCEIKGVPLGGLGTGDMAYYCLAVVVSKAEVSEVEFQASVGGSEARRLDPIVFAISGDR